MEPMANADDKYPGAGFRGIDGNYEHTYDPRLNQMKWYEQGSNGAPWRTR